jgi:hypothetical protein
LRPDGGVQDKSAPGAFEVVFPVLLAALLAENKVVDYRLCHNKLSIGENKRAY